LITVVEFDSLSDKPNPVNLNIITVRKPNPSNRSRRIAKNDAAMHEEIIMNSDIRSPEKILFFNVILRGVTWIICWV
jgi:hypothetical protein